MLKKATKPFGVVAGTRSIAAERMMTYRTGVSVTTVPFAAYRCSKGQRSETRRTAACWPWQRFAMSVRHTLR